MLSDEMYREVALEEEAKLRHAQHKVADVGSRSRTATNSTPPQRPLTRHQYICITILFAINLLNFMDRYTIASILTNIQAAYKINDDWAGFLQTVFMIFFMICAPISGYLADRYERKWIMITGLIVWITAVFASSFVPDSMFWLFLVLRGIVGVGEASYVCVAPSVIADMFTDSQRSRVLMFFYFAIPLGCGLGFMLGSEMADLTGDWRWGIRVTPFLGIFLTIATIFFINEPPRETSTEKEDEVAATSFWDDIKYLVTHKTFGYSTIGSTMVVFTAGTLAWWMPSALEHAFNGKEELEGTGKTMTPTEKANESLVYGALTCIGGSVGVLLGTFISQMWKDGKWCFRVWPTSRADALVCGLASLISAPFLFAALHLMLVSTPATFAVLFFAMTFFCFNWAINIDLLLYTIVPRRRSTATALQTLIIHLFGDATGPYVVGFISDRVRGSDSKTALNQFNSLKVAFYVLNAALIVSGVAFLAAAYYVREDKRRFDAAMGYEMKEKKEKD